MGITKKTISHKREDHIQMARAVDGVIVVFRDRENIFAQDSRGAVVVRRGAFAMRGSYRRWRYLRERILTRRHLSIGTIQRLACHYGFEVHSAEELPQLDKIVLKKEAKPHEPDIANRI